MSDPTRARQRRRLAGSILACTFMAVSCTEPVGPDPRTAAQQVQLLPRAALSVVPVISNGESTTGVPLRTLPLFATTMRAINEANWVVGQNNSDALLWRGGDSFERLPRPTLNAANMAAFALNDQGLIVGQWGGIGGVGIRWQDGASPQFLPTPPGYFNGAAAVAVDEAGNILVSYLRTSPCNDGPNSLRTAAVLRAPYAASDYILLQGPECENELQAQTIQDGVVLGFLSTRFSPATTSGTFRWDLATGNPVTLTPDIWFPVALAGSYATGSRNQMAVRSVDGGAPQDLGTLGGATSRGNAVNSLGWVVGSSLTATGETHAFLWTPAGGMIDLGTVGGTFSHATGINDQGHIVGDATNVNGARVPVIWIVAPPAGDQPPVIVAIPDQTVAVGETLTVTPAVTDADGDPFTVSWSGVPANATANGSLSFTPAADQVDEEFVVTVTATQDDDVTLFSSESFVITVLPAVVPSADFQVVLAPATAQQQFTGDAVAYQASVHNAGPDAASAGLTIELQYPDQTEWGVVPPEAAINGIFFLELGVVASGQTVDVPFEVVFDAWGVHAVTATVAGVYEELEPDDNVATYDQVIDLDLGMTGVQTGGLDIPGVNIADGEGLAVVGVHIPGALIAGGPDWDVFLPADLTPATLLPGGQLLQGAVFTPGGQFVPAVQVVSGRVVPDDVGDAPLRPAEFIPAADAWLPGRVFLPAVNQWDPAGRLMFARGGTNLRVNDRAGTTLSLERGAGPGLAVNAAGGTTDAALGVCTGSFLARMGDADRAEFACGSLTTSVLLGEVTIVLDDGTRVDVPAGATAVITELEDGYDITAADGPVTVTLAGGSFVVSAGRTAFVGPPSAMVDAIRHAIEQLVGNADLTVDAAAGLLDKLDAVADDLAKGKVQPVHNKLTAFIREVESLVRDGRLGADDGQALIDAASALGVAL